MTMNWMTIVILIVAGMLLIAVDFYLPGFVLGSIGVVLMLVAVAICFDITNSLNKAIILFCFEVVLGIGAGYASIKYFPKTAAGKKMIRATTAPTSPSAINMSVPTLVSIIPSPSTPKAFGVN